MKIKISKSQWELIGKTAGWVPQDPMEFSDKDLDAIYDPETEEEIMSGPDEIDENYAYKSGYNKAIEAIKKHGIKAQKDTSDNPYRVDTEQGQKKFDQWMKGFNDAFEDRKQDLSLNNKLLSK